MIYISSTMVDLVSKMLVIKRLCQLASYGEIWPMQLNLTEVSTLEDVG